MKKFFYNLMEWIDNGSTGEVVATSMLFAVGFAFLIEALVFHH